MRVKLTAEAELELEEATAWYLSKSPQIAARFMEDYRHAKRLVAETPTRWAEIGPGVRRIVFRRYPYSLIYVVEEKRVVVLAVKHDKRHPDYWRHG